MILLIIYFLQIREMLDRYWPWEKGEDSRPRGLRNLRLEELFPNKDFLKVIYIIIILNISTKIIYG